MKFNFILLLVFVPNHNIDGVDRVRSDYKSTLFRVREPGTTLAVKGQGAYGWCGLMASVVLWLVWSYGWCGLMASVVLWLVWPYG